MQFRIPQDFFLDSQKKHLLGQRELICRQIRPQTRFWKDQRLILSTLLFWWQSEIGWLQKQKATPKQQLR